MTSLEFCDKHNMVAYLEKSEGNEAFHQIIDFLSGSHIKYALTESPTVYALIEQFWQAAALCTIEDRVMGLTTLPTAKIFKQLALIGASKGYSGVVTPLFDTMLIQHHDEDTSPSRITSSPSLSPQETPIDPPSTSQPPNTPSIHTSPITKEATPMPHESPLHSVHSLGRDKGSLSLNELTVLCTSLSKKVESLEFELKQTKKTYSTALTKLILRVKKLENTIKTTKARRRARVVFSEDEDAA
ncbi:hypothetical protein Tco_1169543 [Tanacetum coccineum]